MITVTEPQRAVHLEGMGLLGSMLAWHLFEAGIQFTWHDIDTQYRAWEASSGLIYPSGDAFDMKNYRVWEDWFLGSAPWSRDDYFRDVVGKSLFWYASKSPPNGGTYSPIANIGPIRCGSMFAYHLDVPRFVRQTRETFGSLRTKERVPGVRLIVAHGFSPRRLDHVVWGWTAHARLLVNERIGTVERVNGGLRSTFYLRVGRYKFGYANVSPSDTTLWTAGSAHIVQAEPHPLEMKDKVQRWRDFIEETTEGLAKVEWVGEPTVGWRPAPSKTSLHPRGAVQTTDGTIYMPPLEGNGVRYSPTVCAHVLQTWLGVPSLRTEIPR
jgi:hypothetical protein